MADWKYQLPLLVIGNTADPVTPLAAAKKTAAGFTGAVVLTQDSPGHSSFNVPSNCTDAYVRSYFLNGTLRKKAQYALPTTSFSQYLRRTTRYRIRHR
ncbi:hypothetical protein BDZ89DRAFT_1167392 [Hymenopellis radicata]|nr:hypothetical protein BDZ89DRAFT_1167392 [Hymenopellis radicata]